MASENEQKPIELQYFEAGSTFFNENYVLLGYHITDASQQIGELNPQVKAALDELAIATARRMTAIMRGGPAQNVKVGNGH